MTTDSYSYDKIDYDKSFRTPAYPTFIKIMRKISGEESYLKNVIRVQKVAYFVSVIFFYLAIEKITKKRAIPIIASLLYGCLPSLFCWNLFILTESFAIVFTVLIAYLTISYLVKPNAVFAIAISILSFLAIMLRPAMIFLLPIFLVFWIIKTLVTKEKTIKTKHKYGLISCILAIALVIGYCFSIQNRFGFFGVSFVSDLNKTWMMVDSGVYANFPDAEKIKIIESHANFDSYFVLTEKYGHEETMRFVNETITQNKRGYAKYLAEKVVHNSDKTIHAIYAAKLFEEIDLATFSGMMLPINFGIVYLVLLVGFIYIFYSLLRYRVIDWMITFALAFIFSNLFLSIFMAPNELQRLFIVSIPLIIVLASYWVSRFVFKVKGFEEQILSRKPDKRLSLLIWTLDHDEICKVMKKKKTAIKRRRNVK
ncbi:MAG: glycosyltransferase family 39 protein [Candidatus Saccharibacteria bacterium]|nr:glycosyltransferase family 39 protein [Candidatus Saccharibacteria bacterium]